MKKTYGVCVGMLAMGLAVLGAPVSKAQSLLAADEAGSGSVPSTTSATSASATPAASSPADLDRRIEALETELSELRTALAAKKEAETAAATAVVATPVPAAQDAAKPPEKVTVAGLFGPTSVSGFVDTYYQVNFNHNSDRFVGFRPFDFRDRGISLNMVELILDKAPDPMGGAEGRTGYHVSLGFGDAMKIVNSAEPLEQPANFAGQILKEAYFSYLAPLGSGLQVDVGKFVTPMGAEVIESKDNWNYSRGLLFGYAIPFYHFGVRAKYTFNAKYNLTGFVVNGWNSVVDNNSGKTYGFSFVSNPTKTVSYTINYLAGPELATGSLNPIDTEDVWRQTWDAIVTYSPTSKLSLMANFDYGRGDRTTTDLTVPPVYWTGGAGYVKYAIDANDYVAGRYEYYDDHDGFTTGSSTFFGSAIPHVHYNEITATYQRTLGTHLLARFEYRRDMASAPVYGISNFDTPTNHQDTVALGLIFLFDSRDAK